MKHAIRPMALALLILALLAPGLPAAQAQAQGPVAQIGRWTLNVVDDWRAGVNEGLLVANNAGGELRLTEEQTSGSFTSAPFEADFAPNAAGATWQADLPLGTSLNLELRARGDAPPAEGDREAGWGPWLPLVAGDATAGSDPETAAVPDVLALPGDTRFLQLRASFGTAVVRASAVLDRVTVSYLRTAQPTPIFVGGLPRRPIPFGANTLSARPSTIARADWSGKVAAAQPARRDPRGVIIHQIDATTTPTTTLDLLRAQLAYQTEVLGWKDLSYHYLIDNDGNLFEGRLGGPTSAADRLSGGDTAVHVAMIAPRGSAPSDQAQSVLISLLAWLGQAYRIAPAGQHFVISDGRPIARPNIAGHSEAAPAAPDPYQPLRDLLPQLRARADQATVRGRWYFAEGNVADYSQRLAFFNPGGTATDARVTLIRPGGTPITQQVAVPAGARADLTLNDLVSGADTLPAIVEANGPLLVERTMGLTTDIDSGAGVSALSRVWYFAEGSAIDDDTQTYLILFNPQAAPVAGTITFMRSDGIPFEQPVTVPAQGRIVVAAHDLTLPDGTLPLKGASFGMRIIAAQPIAAERTMRFGPRIEGKLPGLHTSPGISTLARRWYFAEGTTEGDFRMRLLVLNPNDQPANAEATFLAPDGTAESRRYAIPPRSQLAIDVNEVVPNQGVSTIVQADRPIAAERSLVFNGGAGGTVTAGAAAPSYRWAFVEGRTSDATYFLCVSNPGRQRATVTVEFRFADGATNTQQFSVPGSARYTLAVHEILPNEAAITAVVRGTQPIVVERSIYPGGGSRGGATTLGAPLP